MNNSILGGSSLKQLSKAVITDEQAYPEKVLQFGTGNFLRAFSDWQIHEMNKKNLFNGSVVVVQSTPNGTVSTINEQQGLYTLYLQGIKENKPVSEHQVISSISRGLNLVQEYDDYLALAKNPDLRFILSNTTEAGITFNSNDRLHDRPQKSFPGKLTAFLYERYQFFQGDLAKGFIILPCELIEDNGNELKRIIKKYADAWKLEAGFHDWIEEANTFCNTLVDRIVPGFPKDTIEEITAELGYTDKLIVSCEQFHLFVIEGPEFIKDEFPAEKAGLNVHVVDDLSSFRLKKVRILNGAHTVMTPVAFLYGLNTVREAVTKDTMKDFVEHVIYNEILPTLKFPQSELNQFANDVLDRFKNPYIHHYLSSIALNSTAKFKARILPTLLDYFDQNQKLPTGIVFSLSSLLYFYRGKREDEYITLVDDEETLSLFKELWNNCDGSKEAIEILVSSVLSEEKLWGINLNEIPNLKEMVTNYLIKIYHTGIKEAIPNQSQLKEDYNESVH